MAFPKPGLVMVFMIAIGLALKVVFPNYSILEGNSLLELAGGLARATIFIPYMFMSERVMNTFRQPEDESG